MPRAICRECGGFPVVSITTGERHLDGSRVLLHVVCRTCNGTGLILPAPALSQTGR
ncbi:hypothetical protein [Streptomyces sp. NPDC088794]|uniref:hypothetical protein n=1 Tax=Streptomyces sp. NPDC088794 TaxID=3365902 RepID=UPI0037FF6ABF